jgi:hypothetical protein
MRTLAKAGYVFGFCKNCCPHHFRSHVSAGVFQVSFTSTSTIGDLPERRRQGGLVLRRAPRPGSGVPRFESRARQPLVEFSHLFLEVFRHRL